MTNKHLLPGQGSIKKFLKPNPASGAQVTSLTPVASVVPLPMDHPAPQASAKGPIGDVTHEARQVCTRCAKSLSANTNMANHQSSRSCIPQEAVPAKSEKVITVVAPAPTAPLLASAESIAENVRTLYD